MRLRSRPSALPKSPPLLGAALAIGLSPGCGDDGTTTTDDAGDASDTVAPMPGPTTAGSDDATSPTTDASASGTDGTTQASDTQPPMPNPTETDASATTDADSSSTGDGSSTTAADSSSSGDSSTTAIPPMPPPPDGAGVADPDDTPL